jgi:hypothetical protein
MAKSRDDALAELEERWRRMFSTLHAGGEVPPTLRLRTEGLMEALVLLELASIDELQAALARCYAESYGSPPRDDWRELFPFPQIPGFGQRAPVYPSTRE